MGALFPFPATDTMFARLTERQKQANIAAERDEAIRDCKRIIDNPRGYTDAQLREVCGFYMSYGDGGVHYLRADEHIAAINIREKIARNRAAQTPKQVASEHRDRWPAILLYGAFGAAILLSISGFI